MTQRAVKDYWTAMAAQDGAGVRLNRALGAKLGQRLDPFLMMDAFSSDDPNDYIAGFPAHPHRGFETVTYIVNGHMKHKDHLGNEGDLQAGGVQWMTAGRGIIHEEMPQQEEGLLRGFQIWLNLPAAEKMKAASYKDIPSEAMPWQPMAQAGEIKMIAGHFDKMQLTADETRKTAPIISDIAVKAHQTAVLTLPKSHQALVYVFEGEVKIGDTLLRPKHTAELTQGDLLELSATEDARIILIAGQALNEPIVQYGPFVMNTQAEIEQAIYDYRMGQLTA